MRLPQGFRIIKGSRVFQGNLHVCRTIFVYDKTAASLLLPHRKNQGGLSMFSTIFRIIFRFVAALSLRTRQYPPLNTVSSIKCRLVSTLQCDLIV